MNKSVLARIMPERELLTTAWELVKSYHNYSATAPESRTQQLLEELRALYDGGLTPPQKALAQGLAMALENYFKAR